MRFWKSMAGIVEAELVSADMARSLDALARENICLYHMVPEGELTMVFSASRSDYRRIRRIARKRGDALHLRRRMGLYWKAKALLARPVLVVGLLVLSALVLFLPTRIFFFRVTGNQLVSTNRILWEAENCGLGFGASRREVRSEKMKNALLSAIEELSWAGINTHGCVAVISVTEKSPQQPAAAEASGVSSLIAARDAVVTSCTVTRGSALCKPGQAVTKGQVLISGYTDCGICIQAGPAEGEVFGLTERNFSAVTPAVYTKRLESTGTKRRWSLIVGKKRINLWFGSGIWDTECGRMYQEYPLTLPGDFQLPVKLVKEEWTAYQCAPEAVSPETAQSQLRTLAQSRLKETMVAGSVRSRVEAVAREGECYRLTGTYGCLESIGVVQWEQIGESNG